MASICLKSLMSWIKITHIDIMRGVFSIIISSATNHLGLFDDLKTNDEVVITSTSLKELDCFYKNILRKIDFKYFKNSKYKWFQFSDILNNKNTKCVLVIDTALAEMDLDFLYKLKSRKIKVFLFLINSINADSPLLKAALTKINAFDFDKIFSFDLEDCRHYGFEFLGFNYYSKHELPIRKKNIDAYFIGSIKGGRGQLIIDVFNYLNDNQIETQFDVRSNNGNFIVDGMNHLTGKWIPYADVLQGVSNTNCIVEILQKNQEGATLRYFEAVVYNKKLLSNNTNIIDYPFYDERFMKIFRNPEDIDIEWLKLREPVNYNYNGDFSPIHLVKKVMSFF